MKTCYLRVWTVWSENRRVNVERLHFPEASPSTAPNSLHALHLPARAHAGGGDTLMTRVREAAAAAAASCLTKQQQHRRNTEQVSRR